MKLSYKVKFQLQTDILEQAWSSYKLLLNVEIPSHLPKNIFLGVCSYTKIRVKYFLEELYLDKIK